MKEENRDRRRMARKRLDDLVVHFPSCAGELWVHVGESANYISSILSLYDVIPGCPAVFL